MCWQRSITQPVILLYGSITANNTRVTVTAACCTTSCHHYYYHTHTQTHTSLQGRAALCIQWFPSLISVLWIFSENIFSKREAVGIRWSINSIMQIASGGQATGSGGRWCITGLWELQLLHGWTSLFLTILSLWLTSAPTDGERKILLWSEGRENEPVDYTFMIYNKFERRGRFWSSAGL